MCLHCAVNNSVEWFARQLYAHSCQIDLRVRKRKPNERAHRSQTNTYIHLQWGTCVYCILCYKYIIYSSATERIQIIWKGDIIHSCCMRMLRWMKSFDFIGISDTDGALDWRTLNDRTRGTCVHDKCDCTVNCSTTKQQHNYVLCVLCKTMSAQHEILKPVNCLAFPAAVEFKFMKPGGENATRRETT